MATQSPPADQLTAERHRWRSPVVLRVASLAPFALAVAFAMLARSYFCCLFEPAGILGVPYTVVLEAVVLGWAALGALIVWTTGSRVAAALATAVLTLPSMFALILGPALILVLQNLP